MIILVGDIFSFLFEVVIEWVLFKFKDIGILYIYIVGNYDWYYEGMEGIFEFLCDMWIEWCLLLLY